MKIGSIFLLSGLLLTTAIADEPTPEIINLNPNENVVTNSEEEREVFENNISSNYKIPSKCRVESMGGTSIENAKFRIVGIVCYQLQLRNHC